MPSRSIARRPQRTRPPCVRAACQLAARPLRPYRRLCRSAARLPVRIATLPVGRAVLCPCGRLLAVWPLCVSLPVGLSLPLLRCSVRVPLGRIAPPDQVGWSGGLGGPIGWPGRLWPSGSTWLAGWGELTGRADLAGWVVVPAGRPGWSGCRLSLCRAVRSSVWGPGCVGGTWCVA